MGPLRVGRFAAQTAVCRDLAPRRDAARDGRAAAMQRRRQLSQGKQALNDGANRTAAAAGIRAAAFIVHRGGAR
jgi:hypothetical protein